MTTMNSHGDKPVYKMGHEGDSGHGGGMDTPMANTSKESTSGETADQSYTGKKE